jgi:hypothetical protein
LFSIIHRPGNLPVQDGKEGDNPHNLGILEKIFVVLSFDAGIALPVNGVHTLQAQGKAVRPYEGVPDDLDP